MDEATITARVAQAVSAAAGLDMPPGPDDRLSEIGIDSLDSVSLILDIEATFGIDLPDDAFEAKTIREIVRVVSAACS